MKYSFFLPYFSNASFEENALLRFFAIKDIFSFFIKKGTEPDSLGKTLNLITDILMA